MQLNLNKYKKNILFLPLGGSGEIGLNCNLYHYNGKWIIIDLGIGFIKDIPGVDVVIPDIQFIKNNIKNFLGIFLTHIHDDHIGAIQYLWEELKLPIYTSTFTAKFLKEKLSEYDFLKQMKIIEVNSGDKISVGDFKLEFINLTHSTAEMNAILIRTEIGNILHTGDWKFEEKPIIGKETNKKRLKELGNKHEITAVVCESTNVFTQSNPYNELDLLKSLKKTIKENNKGLIVVTLFASNISRIVSLITCAKAANRKIGIIGRSLYRILKVANEMNYLPNGVEFIDEDDFKKYDKKELLIICSGCQGESGSGLYKLATGTYKYISLTNEDTVIFSSRIIPGNEKEIYSIYNKLAERDVNLINSDNNFVHLSGHYTKSELIEMYSLIKPKMVITTHGEEMHLSEHKRIAKSLGIQKVIKGKNGNIINIDTKDVAKSSIVDMVKLVDVAIDGKKLIPINSHIIGERQKISDAGVIFIVLIIDKKYKLIKSPIINTVGNYDLKKEKDMKLFLENEIKETYSSILNKIVKETTNKFDTNEKKQNFINKELHSFLDKVFKSDMGKKPFITIEICQI